MAEKSKDAAKRAAGPKRAAKPDPAAVVLAVIAEMPAADRRIAKRLHEVILTSAPELSPKLWYGQPAYAKGGKVVCFFRGAAVDKERYLSLGFSSEANLDDGSFWATSFAVVGLTKEDEQRIAELVQQAVS